MIKHYILIAIRIFRRRPGFYLINILGLSIGIAACVMITHYVRFNKNFDTQSPFYSDTYRVLYTRWLEMGDRVEFASCSPPVAPMMKEQFPQVEAISRMFRVDGIFFHDDVFFEEERVFYSETPIFDVLGIGLISGDYKSCLDQPGKMAISQSTAKKYFGDTDPMGKVIYHNKNELYQVAAVFEDFPSNMHFQADILLSFQTYENKFPQIQNGWINSGFYTYVRLQEGTDHKLIDKGLEDYIDREFGEALAQSQMGLVYKLQPVRDIHLGSRLMHELKVNSDRTTIGLLALVSWFILLIAWVNFFNLSTIASIKRLREIGIRKVSGAQQKQLFFQFLTEAVLINLTAILIALLFVEILSPPFYSFANLPAGESVFSQSWFPMIIAVIFIVGTLSAGLYSGLGIAGKNLVKILKGTNSFGENKAGMRKVLVTFQFAIAIGLISATAGVYMQYRHMLQRDLGFQLDGKLVLKAPVVGEQDLPLKFTSFRNELKQIDGIQNASFSSIIPGKSNMFNRGGFYRQGDQPGDSKNLRVTEADVDFFETLGIRFIAGEGFTGNPEIDRDRVVVNQNAALLLGFEDAEDASGNTVHLGNRNLFISGVVVDFFQLSPKEVIEPQMFWQPVRNRGYFTLDYGNNSIPHIISQIEPLYSSFFPGNPFDYFFLDDYYNAQFQHDRRFGMVFGLFSLMVIMVTILGLIGLSAYTANQRKKELGIRKILGASHSRLFMLLFSDYLLLWLVAGIIAIPAVILFLNRWLNGFAVRMQLNIEMFLIPLLLVLAISIITVYAISVKIIRQNPVENISAE